jgi:hypothetical protein
MVRSPNRRVCTEIELVTIREQANLSHVALWRRRDFAERYLVPKRVELKLVLDAAAADAFAAANLVDGPASIKAVRRRWRG